MKMKVKYVSVWEEGVVETNAILDTLTGEVSEIESSNEGGGYENLVREYVKAVEGDWQADVEFNEDNVCQVISLDGLLSIPTVAKNIAFHKKETMESLQTIRVLMSVASGLFAQIDNLDQELIHDFHIEGASLNHCLRWGEQASTDLVVVGPDSEAAALQYRIAAMDMLRKAQELDGLQPIVVTHLHEYSHSTYLGWSKEVPDDDAAASILDFEYEPDRGESLLIGDGFTLEEVTGVSESSRIKGGEHAT